ncbi:MAG: ATP-binding cassette domain-containing protein, partial [Spirochaetales bacterium]|nr:ATP-binding cassette domain-containing protein [Spirochaetales bacterium]
MMELKHVSHVYDKGLPFETRALNDISFEVCDGDFLGIAGRTGSGKSTLIRIMASLIAPTGGCVALESGKRVGISFQFPE